jgi:hypothetical protein
LYGKGYVIQHCISLFQKEQETQSYQIFVTELLTGIARGMGAQVNTRYVDLLYPKEEKSADDIINHIKEGLR